MKLSTKLQRVIQAELNPYSYTANRGNTLADMADCLPVYSPVVPRRRLIAESELVTSSSQSHNDARSQKSPELYPFTNRFNPFTNPFTIIWSDK